LHAAGVERRYGLGHTSRTAGGHRQYTRQEVERLYMMRKLVRSGVAAAAAAGAVGALTATGPAAEAPSASPRSN
jgi:DNA-binding transcriptional MerR regulator